MTVRYEDFVGGCASMLTENVSWLVCTVPLYEIKIV